MTALTRSSALLLVLILVVGIGTAEPLVRPQAAPAAGVFGIGLPSPCDLIPNDVAKKACKIGTNPVGAIGGLVGSGADAVGLPSPGDVAGKAAGEIANAIVVPVINQFAILMARATLKVLSDTANFVNKSTTPNLTQGWFLQQASIFYAYAFLLAFSLLLLRGTRSIKNVDPREAGATGVQFLTFVKLTAFLPALVYFLVKFFDDEMTPAWMALAQKSAHGDLTQFQVDFGKGISSLGSAATEILLPFIFLLLGLIGAVFMEIMLLFRMGMLFIVTAVEIFGLACMVGGEWGRGIFRKATWTLIALIPMKFVMAVILVIGLNLFGAGAAPAIVLGAFVLIMTPALTWAYYRNVSGHDPQVPNTARSAYFYLKAKALAAAAAG